MSSTSSLRVVKCVELMMCDLLRECGSVYGFDGEDAIARLLGVKDTGLVSEKRGRPKKAGKDVSCEKVVDLFAACVSEATVSDSVEKVVDVVADVVAEDVMTVVKDESVAEVVEKDECDELADLMGGLKVSEKKVKKDKKITDEEKAQKKAEEKALSEAKKEAEKIKKAEEKALSEAKKEAEKIKKAEEKALSEAKKEAEKIKKAEEKALSEAKKEAEKVKKAEEKAKKEPKKAAKEDKKEEETKCEEKVEERPKITVTRFEFEGKQYLKSSENILYDASSREEMGIWCEETKSIKELPQDEDEEMDEESYEE